MLPAITASTLNHDCWYLQLYIWHRELVAGGAERLLPGVVAGGCRNTSLGSGGCVVIVSSCEDGAGSSAALPHRQDQSRRADPQRRRPVPLPDGRGEAHDQQPHRRLVEPNRGYYASIRRPLVQAMRGPCAMFQRVTDGEPTDQTFLPAPSAAAHRLVPPRGGHDIRRLPRN
jgi:hypothetical protein